jgi:L-asparaginase/Glu-tRNA(Gln) amidotransferase subunit D
MSPLRGLVGVANYGKNDFFTSPEWRHTTQSEFDTSGVTRLPRVDIIFASVDMSPDLIDCAVANGAKGIVIAGVGNGNMNVAAAANAVKKGVVVVRSSRVPTGTVGRNVELNDDKLGFIASDELNPQKARVLLALALLGPYESGSGNAAGIDEAKGSGRLPLVAVHHVLAHSGDQRPGPTEYGFCRRFAECGTWLASHNA